MRDKVEDHFWEVDGLAEYYSVREFTFRIRQHPDDDPNKESSSELDTTSDSDDNPVADYNIKNDIPSFNEAYSVCGGNMPGLSLYITFPLFLLIT